MGRKQTIELAREEAMERVAATTVSKLLVLAPPWALLVVFAILAAVSHAKWGAPPAVTWVAMASTLCTVVLSLLTWAVSHMRGMLGRAHSTATVFLAGLWFTIATITGIWQPVTFAMLFFGGLTIGIGWNIRAVIRQHNPDTASTDPLASLFNRSKESFGLGGAKVRTTEATEFKVKGKMALPAGEKTADDVIKKVGNMESGMRVPPGAVQVAADQNDASQAHFTVTDPRVMHRPLPWPGAYRPGGSIDDALRVGLFQDMDEVLHTITGHHVQVMGKSGSGKSIGGGWNYFAEGITRTDLAIFAADVTKGEQTLGVFRSALHRFETTKAGARAMIDELYAGIKPRTDYLAERGYQRWVPGCGLLYWLVWLEEAPDVIDALGDKGSEKLEKIAKALRSAGGTLVLSLQRSDYTQMPTIMRGQLANMCFGVESDSDAAFGLSEAQQRAEAAPEMWGSKQPGMAYLDAPSIPQTHIAMPLRTFAWSTIEGDDEAHDRDARARMAAHVKQWPAAAKQMDPFTAKVARLPAPVPVLVGASAAVPATNGTGGPTLLLQRPQTTVGGPAGPGGGDDSGDDAEGALKRLADAAAHVIATQQADPAALGRRLNVDEIECLRLLEALERKGIVGPGGPRGREVLVDTDDIVTELVDTGDPVAEYVTTADPSPDITAGPDDEVPDLTGDPVAQDDDEDDDAPRKLGPAESRRMLCDWLRERHAAGRADFRVGELQEVLERTGMGRGWAYKACGELEDVGALERTDKGFTIADVDQLGETDGTAEL